MGALARQKRREMAVFRRFSTSGEGFAGPGMILRRSRREMILTRSSYVASAAPGKADARLTANRTAVSFYRVF